MKTYKLMYLFGAWITKEVFAAESDAEAVFDADEVYKESRLQEWPYSVALWCTDDNRIVKTY